MDDEDKDLLSDWLGLFMEISLPSKVGLVSPAGNEKQLVFTPLLPLPQITSLYQIQWHELK